MGFLAKFIPGGWVLYALIGVAVFGAGSFAGYKARGAVDAPIIARAQTAQAQAEAATAQTRTALADQQKQIALDAQAASEKAVATQTALQAQVSDLTAKLAKTDKARQAASSQLLSALRTIPHEQQATLSAGVTDYLRRVHDAQTSGANPASAPDRRPDPIPIPPSPARVP